MPRIKNILHLHSLNDVIPELLKAVGWQGVGQLLQTKPSNQSINLKLLLSIDNFPAGTVLNAGL